MSGFGFGFWFDNTRIRAIARSKIDIAVWLSILFAVLSPPAYPRLQNCAAAEKTHLKQERLLHLVL
ncbi:hypothetical protein [Microcoleus sp.]|uniref:hypothetical protein n=1 Tax=Microcoleus sp. TaxID=44472 RepID=UPI003594461D